MKITLGFVSLSAMARVKTEGVSLPKKGTGRGSFPSFKEAKWTYFKLCHFGWSGKDGFTWRMQKYF